jgi:hypothetical protein
MYGPCKVSSKFAVSDPPHRAVRLTRRQVLVARPLREGDPRLGIASASDRFRPLDPAAAEATKLCACP